MTSGNSTTGSAGLSLAVFHPDGRLAARYPLNRMNIGSGAADTICVEGVGAAFASIIRTVGEEYMVRVNATGATLSSEETGTTFSELTLAEGVKFRIGGVLISCDRETPFQSGVDELSDICPFCLTQMPDRAATACHDCGRSLQWLGDSRWSGWTPTTLGGYRIRRVIGSGGMGVVLLGIDGNDRLAAVKVIRSKFPNPSVLRRFDAEVAIIRDMPPHPNIVGYKGHGIEAQRLRWLAMEWVEGVTLADHLASEPQHKLSIERISLIMGQLIQGLRHLHNNGIAHRDLKPANIFLRPNQGVTIVDFGIARAPDTGAGLTTTGHLAGTKNYASPEQYRGGEVGPASDLYSLGLIWQEMLTGANTGGALRIKRGDCPREWADTIGDMLELEPSSRPTLERIEAALRMMKESAPPPKVAVGPGMKERFKQLAILAQSALQSLKTAGRIIRPTRKSTGPLRPDPEPFLSPLCVHILTKVFKKIFQAIGLLIIPVIVFLVGILLLAYLSAYFDTTILKNVISLGICLYLIWVVEKLFGFASELIFGDHTPPIKPAIPPEPQTRPMTCTNLTVSEPLVSPSFAPTVGNSFSPAHNIIIQLRVGSEPYYLSTGVPCCAWYQWVDTPTLWAAHPELGEVNLLLTSPDPGLRNARQAGSFVSPATSRSLQLLKRWAEAPTVPFNRLSSPSLFWVEDKKQPTHLLMDGATRRLMGVIPWNPELSGPVWGRIKTGFEAPQSFPPPPSVWEDEEIPKFYPYEGELLRALGRRVLYACLHPCPLTETNSQWAWDGIQSVSIPYDKDRGFDIHFEFVCEAEKTLGLA